MHKIWSTRAGLYEVHTCLHRMLQHRHRLRCITSKPPIWSNSRGNYTTSISPDSSIVRRCSHSDQTGSKVTTRTARAQRQRIIAGETAYVYIGLSHGSPEAREASLTFHHSQSRTASITSRTKQRRSTMDVSDRCVGELPPARPSALNS